MLLQYVQLFHLPVNSHRKQTQGRLSIRCYCSQASQYKLWLLQVADTQMLYSTNHITCSSITHVMQCEHSFLATHQTSLE